MVRLGKARCERDVSSVCAEHVRFAQTDVALSLFTIQCTVSLRKPAYARELLINAVVSLHECVLARFLGVALVGRRV